MKTKFRWTWNNPVPDAGPRHLARRAAERSIDLYLDAPGRFADFLRRMGWTRLEEKFLIAMFQAYPYDWLFGERLGHTLYERYEGAFPRGTIERQQFVLNTIGVSVPSERLSAAYFENLELLLRDRVRRATPGKVVLGLGTGRSGSTSLAAILRTVDGALATHENPAIINWQPMVHQLRFHMRRFSVLRDYFSLVSDASHWWLNALDAFFEAFPDGKAIGLVRETEACVDSFLTIRSKNTDFNHWVEPHNRIWHCDHWHPSYPSYALPKDAKRNSDGAKRDLVHRYVVEYNEELAAIAADRPDRLLVLRTEELDAPGSRQKISDHIGCPIGMAALRLNTGSIDDSTAGLNWF
jgi:hypothetical protein